MSGRISLVAALALLGTAGMGASGCAHADRARAEYHEDRADRAAEHGHFIKAAKEEHRAHEAEHDAASDPLP